MNDLSTVVTTTRKPRPDQVDLAERIARNAPLAVAASKQIIRQTRGLTEEESFRLGERLLEVPGRFGVGLLLVEHDIELVTATCDEVIVLDFGQVIAHGAPDEVLASDVVADAYLGV